MSQAEKGAFLYEGKGKKVFSAPSGRLILFFKDDLTAFQGAKRGFFKGKGALCHQVFRAVFSYLNSCKIRTHWLKALSARESLCEKARMIPLEVVVRNRLAGSTAKRLGIPEGTALARPPLLESYLKNDSLNDPFVSESQIAAIPLIEEPSLWPEIQKTALKVNSLLKAWLLKADLELIDFKMEFGLNSQGELLLADDFTPDSCRLWDRATGRALDKDRFRKGLGGVESGYREIAQRVSQL